MTFAWLDPVPVRMTSDGAGADTGLVLREWTAADVDALVLLYNTEEMNERTPVPYPFTPEVAKSYVDNARLRRNSGTSLQLAITEGDGEPIGEILIAATEDAAEVELAYAVNHLCAGRGIASRAIGAALEFLRPTTVKRAVVRVADDNPKSWRAARANGFVRTDRPLVERNRKGFSVALVTWECDVT